MITACPRVARILLCTSLLVAPSGCGERLGAPGEQGLRAYADDGRPLRRVPGGAARPNVLLVVIDTLRADALDDMPRLRERAARGVLFTDVQSASSWTLPSLTSLLTSQLPTRHLVHGDDGNVAGLAPLPTWPEILRAAAGYGASAWVGFAWPLAHGTMLEGFEDGQRTVHLAAVPIIAASLEDRVGPSRRPHFLLLHSFEAHDPYGAANHPFPVRPMPPEDGLLPASLDDRAAWAKAALLDRRARARVLGSPPATGLHQRFIEYLWSGVRDEPAPQLCAEIEAGYRAGARWVDELLDNALGALEAHGWLEDSLVIVTGDHGEAFGEHGMLGHGRQLYEELLRVPLIMIGPPPFRGGRRIDAPVALTDVLPTVLDALGLPAPEPCDGRSLLPLLRGEPGWADRAQHAQVLRRRSHTAGASDAVLESVRWGPWKAVLTMECLTGEVTEELYDLGKDPREQSDLAQPAGRIPAAGLPPPFARALEEARERIFSTPLAAGLAPPPRTAAFAAPAPIPAER